MNITLEEPGKTSVKAKVIGTIFFDAIVTVLLAVASRLMVEIKKNSTILCLMPYHNSHELLLETVWN